MFLPEQDVLDQVAADTEAMFHEEGWHQPPQLLSLHLISEHQIGLADAKIQLPSKPGHVLKALAKAMATHHGDKLLANLIGDHIIGWILVHEITMNFDMNYRDLLTTEKDLADIPGGVEVRVVNGMDILGREFKALRVRGQQPYDFAGMTYVQSGLIPEALHGLCTAVAQRLPDNEDLLTALSLVAFATRAEIAAVAAVAERMDGPNSLRFLMLRGDQ